MVLLTALRTCTGQLIYPFIGQNLLPRIPSWRWAVTEMPNCWEVAAWSSQPHPSAEAQVHPDPSQGSGEEENQEESSRRRFVAGVCAVLCMGEDPPWESCPAVPVTPGELLLLGAPL